VAEASRSALDDILRDGARRMLQAAIELEVMQYVEAHQALLDETGRRLVVRNGHLPERTKAGRRLRLGSNLSVPGHGASRPVGSSHARLRTSRRCLYSQRQDLLAMGGRLCTFRLYRIRDPTGVQIRKVQITRSKSSIRLPKGSAV
jgi:hypothetical protein